MKFAILVMITALASSLAYGENNATENIESDLKSSSIGGADLKLSERDKSLAKQWMLTESDWVKYKEVMSGPRGTWSPGLDPITALGVSETDPQERKRYAEIWLRVESKRAELEMAFEVERQRVAKAVLGDQLAVNNSGWIRQWEENRVAVTKKVILFVDANCTDECDDMFKELSASVGNNARLDIYFSDGATSESIGKWAAFMNISPSAVKSRQITLNFDDGRSSELGVSMDVLPQVRVIDIESGEITKTY